MTFFESQTSPLPLALSRRPDEPVVALRHTLTGVELAIPLGERRWLLGSRDGADLALDDPYVSGVHCVLERRGVAGALTVRDRASRNGTFVNGHPIESVVLRPGALLTIGRTTLVAVTAGGRGRRTTFEQIRGSDPALRLAVDHAMRVAQTDCSVLIVGETGTGKDLLARLIHEASRRASGPMVAVNCGGIPRELIGSELFGHERGAFTGAVTERDGYFLEASGGTLFLDELAELPLTLQPHLLRALETRRVRRVGGAVERPVDVRVVAATNRLEGLGTEGSALRLDLYHRLATVVIQLPPLRQRAGDLPELVADMMAGHAAQFGAKEIADEAWAGLAAHAWPGNLRELSHAVSRAMALGGDVLQLHDFLPREAEREPAPPRGFGRGTVPPGGLQTMAAPAACDAAGRPLAPYESMLRDAMVEALRRYPSIRGAASFLGMPKSTFADKARAWGLAPDARAERRDRLDS